MESVKYITVFAFQFDLTSITYGPSASIHVLLLARVCNGACLTYEDSRKFLCQCSPSTNQFEETTVRPFVLIAV